VGFTYADITLVNSYDEALLDRKLMKENEVRKMQVRSLVDTGAITLVINENVRTQLGLKIVREKQCILADGTTGACGITQPVSVYFKNRATACEALVLPDAKQVLLGAIPLEGMDVLVDPAKEELQLPPDRPYVARYTIM